MPMKTETSTILRSPLMKVRITFKANKLIVKDIDGVDISKDDEDLLKSTDSFNESGPQVDYIKKLLNHWNKNYQYGIDSSDKVGTTHLDESNSIEFAAKESIKKTQQAYENLLNKRKEKEIKVTHLNTSSKFDKKLENEQYNEPESSHQLSLDEQLGFSSESDSKNESHEEIKVDNDFVVDEALSDTSEDNFPLNKIEKNKPIERESITKYDKPLISIPDKEEFYIEELNKSQPRQEELAAQLKSEHNNETDEITEDTMWKLVQFLDCEDSERNFNSKNTQRSNSKSRNVWENINNKYSKSIDQSIINKVAKQENFKVDISKVNTNKNEFSTNEHTFGERGSEKGFDSVQIQNMKNPKKDSKVNTERKIEPKQISKISKLYDESEFDKYQNYNSKSSQYDAKYENQSNNMISQTEIPQKNISKVDSSNLLAQKINSNNEVKYESIKKRSEVDSLIKESEMYFNTVINKMNDDLNPRTLQKEQNDEPHLGRIRKNKDMSNNLQTNININLEEKRNFLSKHNRVMSAKPTELGKGKENIGVNIPSKDVWYHVNLCLEKNGYSKISISDNTDPRLVCNTVLSILHDYEQRGQKI